MTDAYAWLTRSRGTEAGLISTDQPCSVLRT